MLLHKRWPHFNTHVGGKPRVRIGRQALLPTLATPSVDASCLQCALAAVDGDTIAPRNSTINRRLLARFYKKTCKRPPPEGVLLRFSTILLLLRACHA